MIIAVESNNNTVYVNTDHIIKACIIDSGDDKPYFLIIFSDGDTERFYGTDAIRVEIVFKAIAASHWSAMRAACERDRREA